MPYFDVNSWLDEDDEEKKQDFDVNSWLDNPIEEKTPSQKASQEQQPQQPQPEEKNWWQRTVDKFTKFKKDVTDVGDIFVNEPELVAKQVSTSPERFKKLAFGGDKESQVDEEKVRREKGDTFLNIILDERNATEDRIKALEERASIFDTGIDIPSVIPKYGSMKDTLKQEKILEEAKKAYESDTGKSADDEPLYQEMEREIEEAKRIHTEGDPNVILIQEREALEVYDQFLERNVADRGFVGRFIETITDPIEVLPFVKDIKQSAEFIADYRVLKKYENGEQLTQSQQARINRIRADTLKAYIDIGIGDKAGEVAGNIPKYAIEFWLTSGLFKGGKELILKKVLGKTGASVLTKEASEELVKFTMKEQTARLVSGLFGSAVQSSVGFVPSISSKTAEYMLPQYDLVINDDVELAMQQIDEGDSFAKALAKAELVQFIEIAAERSGTVVEDGMDFTKKAILSKYAEKMGAKSPSALARLMKQAGWNGIIGEVFEEELTELAQAPVEERKYYAPFFTPEGTERLMVETLGIGAFGGMAASVDAITPSRKAEGDIIDISDMEAEIGAAIAETEAPAPVEEEEELEEEVATEGRTPEASLRAIGAEVNELSKSVQNIRDYMQTQGDTAQTDFISKSITDETINFLSNNPIGANELNFDAEGNITLYRSGNVVENAPNSYSIEQSEGQVPFTINKNEILINTNSQELRDVMSDIYKEATLSDGTSIVPQYLEDLDRWNRLESEVIAMPEEVRPVTTAEAVTPTAEEVKVPVEVRVEPTRRITQLVEGYANTESRIKRLESRQDLIDAQEEPAKFKELADAMAELEVGQKRQVEAIVKETGSSDYNVIEGLSRYIDGGQQTILDFYNNVSKVPVEEEAPKPKKKPITKTAQKKQATKMTVKKVSDLEVGESTVIPVDSPEFKTLDQLSPEEYRVEKKDEFSSIVTKLAKAVTKTNLGSKNVSEIIQQDEAIVNQVIQDRLGKGKTLENITEPQMRKIIPEGKIVPVSEKIMKKVGTQSKAVSLANLKYRPTLLYGGIPRGVFTDGFLLILDEGTAKEVNNYHKEKLIKSEQNAILKQLPELTFDESLQMAKDNVQKAIEEAESQGFPEYEQLIPDTKQMTKADIVGMTNYGESLSFILKGVDKYAIVDASKLAFMLDKLDSKTIYIEAPKKPIAIMKGKKIGGLLMPKVADGMEVLDKVRDAYVAEMKRKPSISGGARASLDQYADIPVQTQQPIKESVIPFPEMVQLARDLMNEYPKVKTPRMRKLGIPNGLFIPAGGGQIQLNPAIFSDINQAAKTLAHEMGHLTDYLPDYTLKRGNLLGRIATLRKFTKGQFSDRVTQSKIDKLDAEAEVIRQQRRNLERDDQGKVIDKKKDLALLRKLRPLNKQIRKLQEGSIKDKEIREELKAVTKLWRPFTKRELMFNANTGKMEYVTTEIDESEVSEGYLNYRYSGEELYADAISMLLNDPALLRETAPKFYQSFFENIDNKPKVRDAYFDLVDRLHGDKELILKRRVEQIYEGYNEAREKRLEIEKSKTEKPTKSFKEKFMQQHVTRFDPAYRKVNERLKEKGIAVSPMTELRLQLEEMLMRNNDAFLYLNKMNQDIIDPIESVGLTEEDLGVILQLERSVADRKDVANPYGLQGEYAQETLDYFSDYLKKERGLSEEQINILHQALKRFRDYQYEVAVAGHAAELYSDEFKTETIDKSKDTYATFQVIEYLHDNYVTAAVQQATGTLKPVENPFVSSVLKSLAIINQTEIQKGKIFVVDTWMKDFPQDIELAKQTGGFGKGQKTWKKVQDREHLIVRRNGVLTAYNVDPYIAEMFNFYSPTEVHQLIEISAKFNRVFKPLVTTWNLSWGFYSNIFRDTRRTYKNLASILPTTTTGTRKGLSIFEYVSEWLKAIPESARFQTGEVTPLLEEMLANKAYTSAFANFDTQANEDKSLAPIMRKYRFLAKQTDVKDMSFKRKLFDASLGKILKGIEFAGSTLETTSKVSGYQILKKRQVGARESAFITRNYVGTPNFIDGGTQKYIDNNVFVFSNVMAQGIRTDLEIATNPTTRSGYWMRTFMIDILPKLMMLAAASGLLGEKLKELMDKATEYDKTNYLIIPLGEEANGKAVYMRIPQDETGRFFSALTWKIGSYMNGQGQEPSQIFALGAGYIPSVTPMWEVGGAWLQYATGRNPYDSYRGRTVIDDLTWKAGGLPVFEKMIQYTTNNLGLSQFSTYDDARDSTFDLILKQVPIINRAFKSTDYGLTELEKREDRQVSKEKARDSIRRRELLEDAVKEVREYPDTFDSVLYDLTRESFGEPPYDSTQKRQITDMKKKLVIGRDEGRMSRELDSLIDATYLDDKIRRLRLYKDSMSKDEYNQLLSDGVKYKAISKELAKRLSKEGLWKQ